MESLRSWASKPALLTGTILLLGGVFIAALWAGIFYVIRNESSDALQNARRETAFLVSAYREYAGRVLTVVD